MILLKIGDILFVNGWGILFVVILVSGLIVFRRK